MSISNRRKKITITLAAFILIIALLHLAVFIFLNLNGKNLLKKYIKTNFAADSEISSVSFRFPFTVVVKGLKCGDVKFSKADISLGLFNPFKRSLTLRNVQIDNLNFTVKIEKDRFSISQFFVKEKAKMLKPQPAEAKLLPLKEPEIAVSPRKLRPKPASIKISKLLISNASAQVVDLTRDSPVIFNLRNVNIALKHFIYPQLPKFYIDINASLCKGDTKSDNLIALKGWADYSRRNMSVKLSVNSADYLMFSEYYPPFWKPDNLGVKVAKLSLDSKLNSVDNDLVIEAVLALDEIGFKEEIQNDSRVNSLKTMLAFFRGEDGKPVLPIKLRTKMDSFQIDFASLQSEFKGKMQLDIGTIIINILDKAKNKIVETGKEVKSATVDKAVDKTKEAAGVVKDVTVDKTVETIKGVVGVLGGIVNGKSEEKPLGQPAEAIERPLQQDQGKPEVLLVTPQENIPTEPQKANAQGQNAAPGAETQASTQPPAEALATEPQKVNEQNAPGAETQINNQK